MNQCPRPRPRLEGSEILAVVKPSGLSSMACAGCTDIFDTTAASYHREELRLSIKGQLHPG